MLKLSSKEVGAAPSTAELLKGGIYLEPERSCRDSMLIQCRFKRANINRLQKDYVGGLLPLRVGCSYSEVWAVGRWASLRAREPGMGQ